MQGWKSKATKAETVAQLAVSSCLGLAVIFSIYSNITWGTVVIVTSFINPIIAFIAISNLFFIACFFMFGLGAWMQYNRSNNL
jgi:hypothetical protein